MNLGSSIPCVSYMYPIFHHIKDAWGDGHSHTIAK